MFSLRQCVTTNTHVHGNLLQIISDQSPSSVLVLVMVQTSAGGVLPGVAHPQPRQEDRHTDGQVSALLANIRKPDYAFSGKPDKRLIPRTPVIWSPVEIIKIR